MPSETASTNAVRSYPNKALEKFSPNCVMATEADSHGHPCLSKDLEGSLTKQQEMKRLGMIETRATVREIGQAAKIALP